MQVLQIAAEVSAPEISKAGLDNCQRPLAVMLIDISREQDSWIQGTFHRGSRRSGTQKILNPHAYKVLLKPAFRSRIKSHLRAMG